MNCDDVIRMAREADHAAGEGLRGQCWHEDRDMRFAALVAAAEREACVSAIEEEMGRWRGHQDITDFRLAIAAIRARSAA